MKKTVQIMGIVAAIFLIIGFGLFILAGWGSLVEYHAFEWRSVQPKGSSTLTQAAVTLAMSILCVGFLTTIITFIMFFTIVIKNAHKKRSEHLGQTS